MSVTEIDNAPMLGGSSYIVSSLEGVQQLPENHRAVIGDTELGALKNHRDFFSSLRQACEFAPMSKWLDLIIESDGISLTAYLDGMGQKAALVNTLGGCVRLQRFYVPETAPRQLRQIFAIIGSVHQYGFGHPGFFAIGESNPVEQFDDRMLNYKNCPPSGTQLTEFYTADCGDRLLATDESVYHYHIGGSLHRGDTLDNVLDSFFQQLCGQGSKFNPTVDYTLVSQIAT
ncbi:MAG: hypothetical protein AAFN77_24455 [Planctomycetota bacterium]